MSAVKSVIIGVAAVSAAVGAVYGLYKLGEHHERQKAEAEAAVKAAKSEEAQKQADAKADAEKASSELKERCKVDAPASTHEQLIRVRTVTDQDRMHSQLERVYQVLTKAYRENRLHFMPWAEGDVPDSTVVQIRRNQHANPQEILLKPATFFNSPVRDKAVVGILQKRGTQPVIFVQCNDMIIAMYRDDRYFSVSGMDTMTGNEAADEVLINSIMDELFKELGITDEYIKSVVGE